MTGSLTPERMLAVWCPATVRESSPVGSAQEGMAAVLQEVTGAVLQEVTAAVLGAFTPLVEVTGSRECVIATRGPARYFGGEAALAAKISDEIRRVYNTEFPNSALRCAVGVADGRFTARQAARQAARSGNHPAVVVVAPGKNRSFLAPLPVSTVADDRSAGLLVRLGIATLGQMAELQPGAMLDRFGSDGRQWHRLARGLDTTALAPRCPPVPVAVETQLDPPADRVETAGFAAASLAIQFHSALETRGMIVTVVRMEAETDTECCETPETPETPEASEAPRPQGNIALARSWRFDTPPTPTMISERVRWQLDGWLSGSAGASRPQGKIVRLRLVAEEMGPGGRQLGFWGDDGGGDERATRVLSRIQSALGPESVIIANSGPYGRGPADQVRTGPWSAGPLRSLGKQEGTSNPPWPGRIASPEPILVFSEPISAEVTDRSGDRLGVNGRGNATGEPFRLSINGGPETDISAWAGPWPFDENWWNPAMRRRRARWQVLTATGAHLLAVEQGRWWLEATY